MTNPLTTPPLRDEIEIAVFGPGIGESILIHCGEGEWICIDSALLGDKCWALWYLDQLGFQADAVRLIVTTHWHADHVKGLADLLTACDRAQFACSSAFRADEFRQMVARFSTEETGAERPPLSELKKAFEVLYKRKEARSAEYRAPIFASAHQILHKSNTGGRHIEVMALSPSAQDVLNACEAFAKYFVPVNEPASGLSPINQNHASVVLATQIAGDLLLLGADLEKTNSLNTGWNAVVASSIRPQGLSILFKVPHHGSANAQSDAVWGQMLVASVCSAVTPYAPSGLPKASEISWLLGKSKNVWTTGKVVPVRVRRRTEVERTIREATARFSGLQLPKQPGTVRFRKKIGAPGPWQVETFGDAKKLVA